MKSAHPLNIISPTAGDTITHTIEPTEAEKADRDEVEALGIHRLPDGSADMKDPRNRKHFEDLEYALHHPDEPISFEYKPTNADMERTRRQERELLDALKEHCSARLFNEGLYSDAAWVRHDGEGYTVRFRDREHRIFEVHIMFDADLAPFADSGGDLGRMLIDACCEKALAERARYFSRMS